MIEKKADSPLKAIRKKCLDCSGGQAKEVENCWAKDCPLYLFRLGKGNRKKNMTEEQREKASLRMKKMWEQKKGEKNEG